MFICSLEPFSGCCESNKRGEFQLLQNKRALRVICLVLWYNENVCTITPEHTHTHHLVTKQRILEKLLL